MLRDRAAHLPLLKIFLVGWGLVLSMVVGYLAVQGDWSWIGIIAAGLFAVCFLLWEERRIRHGQRTQWGILFWVLAQPFLRLIANSRTLVVLGLVVPALFLFYYRLLSPDERTKALERCMRILLPGALYFGVLIVSYVYSGVSGSSELYYLVDMVMALGFAFLACLCCRTYDDLERVLLVYVLGGALQLPVILLQATGLAEHLPGILRQLSVARVGGPLSAINGEIRYFGSFGDYELLAEYLGVTLLLAIGLFVTTRRRKNRWFLLACAFAIFIAGWFTGTRAFLLGVGLGLGILVVGVLVQNKFNFSQLRGLLVVLAVMGFAFWAVIPDQVRSGYIARLSEAQFTGPQAFNRAYLYAIAGSMLDHLPFWGYGAGMMSSFLNAAQQNFASPHSWFLSMLLIAGYPGLFCTGVFILFLLGWSGWLSFQMGAEKYRGLGIVLLSVAVYWIANETKIEFLRQDTYAKVLFFLWGIVACAYSLGRPRGLLGG